MLLSLQKHRVHSAHSSGQHVLQPCSHGCAADEPHWGPRRSTGTCMHHVPSHSLHPHPRPRQTEASQPLSPGSSSCLSPVVQCDQISGGFVCLVFVNKLLWLPGLWIPLPAGCSGTLAVMKIGGRVGRIHQLN